MDPLKKAQLYLAKAREGAGRRDVAYEIEKTFISTIKAGVTLKSIGTSEEELSALYRQKHPLDRKRHDGIARKMLEDLRANHGYVAQACGTLKQDVFWFRKHAGHAGASLEDLGTSEAEIREICRKTFLKGAKRTLEGLRKPPKKAVLKTFSSTLARFKLWLKRAEASLETVGTSEEELELLSKIWGKAEERYKLTNPPAP